MLGYCQTFRAKNNYLWQTFQHYFWAIFNKFGKILGKFFLQISSLGQFMLQKSRYSEFGFTLFEVWWQLQITLLRISRCANSRCARLTCICKETPSAIYQKPDEIDKSIIVEMF